MKRILFGLTLLLIQLSSSVLAQTNDFYEESIDTVNIENEGVRKFMADRSYDEPGMAGNYSLSVVQKYNKGYGSRPNGKTVSWQRSADVQDISRIVVRLIDEGDFTGEVKEYYPDAASTQYEICNMRPEANYRYEVAEVHFDGSEAIVAKGRFYTVGRVRMFRTEGMSNMRDFGGWDTGYGLTTRYGRLFRGNRPEGIKESGKNDFVKNEHLTADLDLRGKNLGKSPFGDGIVYYVTNNARYKLALTSRTQVLADDIHFIAGILRKGGSVYMHCNHGANRCGTLSFLIGGIIGLSEADLSRDYELSAFSYTGMRRNATFGDMLPVIRSYGTASDSLTDCFHKYCLSIGVSQEDIDIICYEMLIGSF